VPWWGRQQGHRLSEIRIQLAWSRRTSVSGKASLFAKLREIRSHSQPLSSIEDFQGFCRSRPRSSLRSLLSKLKIASNWSLRAVADTRFLRPNYARVPSPADDWKQLCYCLARRREPRRTKPRAGVERAAIHRQYRSKFPRLRAALCNTAKLVCRCLSRVKPGNQSRMAELHLALRLCAIKRHPMGWRRTVID
jgi:hypothetical protein